ncbi:hypothetical protein D3C87_1750340 [compost metagenome]
MDLLIMAEVETHPVEALVSVTQTLVQVVTQLEARSFHHIHAIHAGVVEYKFTAQTSVVRRLVRIGQQHLDHSRGGEHWRYRETARS